MYVIQLWVAYKCNIFNHCTYFKAILLFAPFAISKEKILAESIFLEMYILNDSYISK